MKTQIIYVFGTIVGAGIVYAAYKKLKVRKIVHEIPTKWRAIGKLQSLHMHILKNGQEYEIREGFCTKYGLVKKINGVEWRDQSILVYDPKSMEIKSSKQYPVILTITVKPMPWKKIGLSSPDQQEILINLPELLEQTKLNIPNKNCWDCGDEAANFISKIVPKQLEGFRLCYHDYSKTTNTIYHLINKNSVDTLNKNLDVPVSERYFRPNFFVFGHLALPWDEESWGWVKIGSAIFKNTKTCEKSNELKDEKINSSKPIIFSNSISSFLTLFDDLDEILATNENFLLGSWINSAKNASNSQNESKLFEFNARNQITLWGPNGEIKDYASKQWSGMIRDYFKPRWGYFLTEMLVALQTKTPFDQNGVRAKIFKEVERPFGFDTKEYPEIPYGNTVDVAKRIYEKWW